MKYVDLEIMRSLYSFMEIPHSAKDRALLFKTEVTVSLVDL